MLIICGTNRPQAVTRRVSQHALELMNNELSRLQKPSAQLLDLANLKSDIFEQSAYAKKPDWFLKDFQEPILKADGILIVTPEYNGSFPGVLKYFIDMLKFPESLVNVPVAFVGVAAGQFGALRAVEQLQAILHYRNIHSYGKRLLVPKVADVIQADGTLKELEPRLLELISGFIQFCFGVSSPNPL